MNYRQGFNVLKVFKWWAYKKKNPSIYLQHIIQICNWVAVNMDSSADPILVLLIILFSI